jgi:photosystem II stability/assembly factor-like uncharacterized protein
VTGDGEGSSALYISDDGGLNWSLQSELEGDYLNVVGWPYSVGTLILGGDALLFTEDRGLNWLDKSFATPDGMIAWCEPMWRL